MWMCVGAGLIALAAAGAAPAAPPACRPATSRSAFSVAVAVTEYGSGRPLPGAVVTLTHRRNCSKAETRAGEPQCVPTHPHPAQQLVLRCTAGPAGRATFDVPDHDYEASVAGPGPARYLEPWEITKFERAIEDKRRLQETSHAGKRGELAISVLLVPAALIESPNVITTAERATAVARAALVGKGCDLTALAAPPPAPAAQPERIPLGRVQPRMPPQRRMGASNYWGQWRVDFGAAGVDVNAITGEARVVICQAACCQDPEQAPTAGAMYSPFEALADVAAAPLQHVGTTVWPGIFEIPSCVYRNDRVVVVDVYCTTNEMNSASLLVLHPKRGRVRVYAEDRSPISTIARGGYLHWKLESEEPPPAGKIQPPLALGMNLAELVAYEKRRYDLSPPACWVSRWTGARPGSPSPPSDAQCRRKTPEAARAWSAATVGFGQPPDVWYSLLAEFRALARKHSRAVPVGAPPMPAEATPDPRARCPAPGYWDEQSHSCRIAPCAGIPGGCRNDNDDLLKGGKVPR